MIWFPFSAFLLCLAYFLILHLLLLPRNCCFMDSITVSVLIATVFRDDSPSPTTTLKMGSIFCSAYHHPLSIVFSSTILCCCSCSYLYRQLACIHVFAPPPLFLFFRHFSSSCIAHSSLSILIALFALKHASLSLSLSRSFASKKKTRKRNKRETDIYSFINMYDQYRNDDVSLSLPWPHSIVKQRTVPLTHS